MIPLSEVIEMLEEEIHNISKETLNIIKGLLYDLGYTILNETEIILARYESINDPLIASDIEKLINMDITNKRSKLTVSDLLTGIILYNILKTSKSVKEQVTKQLYSIIVNVYTILYDVHYSSDSYRDSNKKHTRERIIKALRKDPTIDKNKLKDISESDIDDILRDEWSGLNYEQIIDKYFSDLNHNLQRDIKKAIIVGTSIAVISKLIKKRIDKTVKNQFKPLSTTEYASMLNRTIEKWINDTDGNYRYHTEKDHKVCSICSKHDGKVYSLHASNPIPPLHSNCRCYIEPIISDI